MAEIHVQNKIVSWFLVGILFQESAKESPLPHAVILSEVTKAQLKSTTKKTSITAKKEEICKELKLPYSDVDSYFKNECAKFSSLKLHKTE